MPRIPDNLSGESDVAGDGLYMACALPGPRRHREPGNREERARSSFIALSQELCSDIWPKCGSLPWLPRQQVPTAELLREARVLTQWGHHNPWLNPTHILAKGSQSTGDQWFRLMGCPSATGLPAAHTCDKGGRTHLRAAVELLPHSFPLLKLVLHFKEESSLCRKHKSEASC
ncbi:hypothetical protein Cadr_000014466 [Camelus dromedarius]|uniref:Uncharacterized protein n=1 Tax=Camelus dromedarius TaxID=9838 RepID=A0A5N4DM85_CAMDR|nr:hypothetical protein Cadr_000014466 [Camelus dromedarius]